MDENLRLQGVVDPMFDGRDENARVTRLVAETVAPNRSTGPSEIDRELQAAIEYKIASAGASGAEVVLDLLNHALKRAMPA